MLGPTPTLLTAEELRALFSRAVAELRAVGDTDLDPTSRSREQQELINTRIRAAIDALRFCSLTAGLLGDASCIPLIIEAFEAREGLWDRPEDDVTTLALGLSTLLRKGAPVTDEIAETAEAPDARLRHAIASGLKPKGERAIAILSALSSDADTDVRAAAKRSLEPVLEVPWWRGKFASDPLERLSPDEALAHKPALEQLSSLLDVSAFRLDEQEIVKLAGSLPDALLVEVAEATLSSVIGARGRAPRIGAMMLARPGGAAALCRLCRAWSEAQSIYEVGEQVSAMLKPLPREAATIACKALLADVQRIPASERRIPHRHSPGRIAAEIVAHCWPTGEDLTPLLDAVLSLSPGEGPATDWIMHALSETFRREDVDPTSILERVIEARLAGYPGRWAPLAHDLDTLLERAPVTALRPVALQAIRSAQASTVRWGIEQLLGPAYDPENDPPPFAFARSLVADPAYRQAIADSRAAIRRCLPALREVLREGGLDFHAAAGTAEAAAALYADYEKPPGAARARAPRKPDKELKAERAALGAFLGPQALRGPPTDDEWRALRAARALSPPKTRKQWYTALSALPPGPRHPEDRALIEEAVKRMDQGDKEMAMTLAMALSATPVLDELPLLDRLPEFVEERHRGLLIRCTNAARRQLGLPETTPSDRSAEDQRSFVRGEWMDQPDEEK